MVETTSSSAAGQATQGGKQTLERLAEFVGLGSVKN